MHDIALRDTRGLEVAFVDAEREAISPPSNFGEHFSVYIMYLHLPLNLCLEGAECNSGDGAAGRTYLFEWTMRAAHHGLFGLPVAAPRLPPVVARAIPLPGWRPVHGPRRPGDRGGRPRRMCPRHVV